MGISGIGMSGIAKILLQQGHKVSGCDQNADNQHIKELLKLGCIISNTHESDICKDPTISTLTYTSAIQPNHPEIAYAHSQNIPIMLRADMLAKIMQEQTSIAIAGSHGKTSTSALVAHILQHTDQEPTIIVGGHINSISTNAQYGSGKYLVAEADESDRSLIKLPKQYAIITNIDLEHLETYKDFEDIKKTFIKFINTTSQPGKVVICLDDSGVQDVLTDVTVPYVTYGQNNNADIQIRNISLQAKESSFEVYQKATQTTLGTVNLPQAGIHYVINATGAIALCLDLGLSFESIKQALQSFVGVDRRFTFKGVSKKHQADIYDDYGHHPKEIIHALTIARNNSKSKLIVVFQPHRFSRTKHLWNDFINLFAQAPIDTLILTDIYSASESPIEGITTQNLVRAIQEKKPNLHIKYCPVDPELKELHHLLNTCLEKNDLLLLLGAGKTNKVAEQLLS